MRYANLYKFLQQCRRFCSATGAEEKTITARSSSKKLMKQGSNLEEVPLKEAFDNAKLIAYYFSASWCSHCIMLLPVIRKMYKVNLDQNKGLVIIFVSFDEDKEIYAEYFKEKHGPWYAIPFGDSLIGYLRSKYEIESLPHVVVVNKEGQLITKKGRYEIESNRDTVVDMWLKQGPLLS